MSILFLIGICCYSMVIVEPRQRSSSKEVDDHRRLGSTVVVEMDLLDYGTIVVVTCTDS